MADINELTSLTVQEQKTELEDLDRQELISLREEEDRETALDNIDRAISKRPKDEDQGIVDAGTDTDFDKEAGGKTTGFEERVESIEAKVDYLIERCKTTSEEGFENYSDNQ